MKLTKFVPVITISVLAAACSTTETSQITDHSINQTASTRKLPTQLQKKDDNLFFYMFDISRLPAATEQKYEDQLKALIEQFDPQKVTFSTSSKTLTVVVKLQDKSTPAERTKLTTSIDEFLVGKTNFVSKL